MIGQEPLLSVRDLTISLPDKDAVASLSFDLRDRETLAIVGESGSGKSLTALALMGLLPPAARITGGHIHFSGQDLRRLSMRGLRQLRGKQIGMIFQEPMTSLNPVMTIGSQIAEVLTTHESLSARAARTAAVELLNLVRIPEPAKRADDYPHRLSGGMRQRVMIAMAVACRPRLLIADEPTTALDVTIQAQVLDLIDRLRRELDMAVLLITHDLGIVGQWADRVVVLYAGHKLEQGTPDALFARPFHPYTRGLLAASPRADDNTHYSRGPLREIAGSISSAAGQPGCPFVPRCFYAASGCREPQPLRLPEPDHAVACPALLPGDRHVSAVGH